MLQIYTGNGKGKTTAALGVALRASGYNMTVIMYSFFKDDPDYGEARAACQLKNFSLIQVGRDAFVNFKNPDPVDLKMCQQGWEQAKKSILNKEADIIILDEFIIALAFNLLNTDEVIEFLKAHKNDVEIILTGRYADEKIIKIADLVTEMQEIKHYFHKGVSSRNGIDH